MSPIVKIILGALATTALAGVLHGPLGLGAKCAGAGDATAVPAAPAVAPATNTTAEAPATAQAVASCQTGVDDIIKGKTINFANGSAYLAADSKALIASLATALKDCAGTTVEVAGHTDQHGSDAINNALSQSRADAVVAALVAQGVPKERLSGKGYGKSKPVDPALTPAADAKNRRIEFSVASAGAAPAAPAAQ